MKTNNFFFIFKKNVRGSLSVKFSCCFACFNINIYIYIYILLHHSSPSSVWSKNTFLQVIACQSLPLEAFSNKWSGQNINSKILAISSGHAAIYTRTAGSVWPQDSLRKHLIYPYPVHTQLPNTFHGLENHQMNLPSFDCPAKCYSSDAVAHSPYPPRSFIDSNYHLIMKVKVTWHTAKYGNPFSEFMLCI